MRIDMTSRQLSELLKPVLPHASTDPDLPELSRIRVELADKALIAVGTDRYTIAAERHVLKPDEQRQQAPPVHLATGDIAAALKLFAYSKDFDPPVKVTIGHSPFPVTIVGQPRTVERWSLTIDASDGTRLIMHDWRDPSHDAHSSWRKTLAAVLARPAARQAPALYLAPHQLARWAAACRKGERLSVFTGSEGDELLLITAGDHFAGAWKPTAYLETPAAALADSPWHEELRTWELGFDETTGKKTDPLAGSKFDLSTIPSSIDDDDPDE